MKNEKGFSLIELLIVVVIIGIIAAIAIPNLLAARRSANEGSAIASLRTIHGAEMTYQSTAGSGNFAGTLTTLNGAGLVDSVLSNGTKSGYTFTGGKTDATTSAPSTFWYSGVPISGSGLTQSGTRKFGVATDGVLRFSTAALTTQFANEAAVNAADALSN